MLNICYKSNFDTFCLYNNNRYFYYRFIYEFAFYAYQFIKSNLFVRLCILYDMLILNTMTINFGKTLFFEKIKLYK